jgi:hypothetical protein
VPPVRRDKDGGGEQDAADEQPDQHGREPPGPHRTADRSVHPDAPPVNPGRDRHLLEQPPDHLLLGRHDCPS